MDGLKNKEKEELLADAKKKYKKLFDNDFHNFERCRSNLKFVYEIDGGQWPDSIRTEREADGRPCLTSNKLRKFAAAVANSERDQRTASNVIPVDDKGDVETARIYSGIIRYIEHISDAQAVYTHAGEQAVAGNVGYWRIKSEELPDSFDQELFLVKIKNQFAVLLDPDGKCGFITEKLTKTEFKDKYPDADEEVVDTTNEHYYQWYDNEDSVFIREYFYKERVKKTIVQVRKVDLSTMMPETETKIFELEDNISDEELLNEGWIIDTRNDGSQFKKTSDVYKVKWAKITGSQVLEQGEWPGKDIPIIEVEGDWVWLEGKLYKRGLIDGAKDDQRMYNFWKTSITERYALALRAPYLVTVKMVDGLKKFWDAAHKKLMMYLPFNPDKQHPGGPKRELAPQVSTGERDLLEVCNRDIEDTIGRYKSSFGQASNERTGVAIRERAGRSEFSTFHFPDNFRRAILKSTRQLIDLIPYFWDTERIQRLIGEDGTQEIVKINYDVTDAETGRIVRLNDLSVGKYDVVEDVKIMSTRRQEQLSGMLSLAEGNPQLGILLAPHIAKMQDWDGAQAIAEEINQFKEQLLGTKQPQSGEGE